MCFRWQGSAAWEWMADSKAEFLARNTSSIGSTKLKTYVGNHMLVAYYLIIVICLYLNWLESWDPENTGKRINLIALEPGNTGKRSILITYEPGNTGKQTMLITCEPGNSGNQEMMISKRRSPTNDEIWRRFRAEISHMRPIQARKLKLLKQSFGIYRHIFWSSYFTIPPPASYFLIVIFY